jgi:lipoate-protein ligase A
MEIFDRRYSNPAEQLACDEALLEFCEENPDHPGFLRFWQSKTYFVVLGYSKRLKDEVDEHLCSEMHTAIFRRCSGGGTVLQGRGSFNYCLILPINSHSEFETITSTNRFIMERHRRACEHLLGERVCVSGHTDLTLNNQKFSGNSQRRKRKFVLFHGAFLLDFDLARIEQVLRMPQQQPEYREGRKHADFLTNINKTAEELRLAIEQVWSESFQLGVGNQTEAEINERVRALVAQKYSREEWNRKI